MRAFGVIVLLLSLLAAPLARGQRARHHSPADAGTMEVPIRYDVGRWILRPVTAAGDTLDLYTDSGGGIMFIARERLPRGSTLTATGTAPNGDSAFTSAWPAMRSRTFPVPAARITTASESTYKKLAGAFPARDGFIGSRFFVGRTWIFDYPARRLAVLPKGAPARPLGGATIPFTFQEAAPADKPWYPRIRVEIDGDTLDLLFDTGATTELTPAALASVNDGRPASRAASFIMRTVADRWRARHPGWRYLNAAEVKPGADMIEVPRVTVAGSTVGPVWFTIREDPNFTTFMSKYMDRPIVGALGGSGLQYFRVVADYPNARATFTTVPARR